MLWSAGLEAPRHVWVHGWLLVKGGERMSKSRGNFFDPNDVVAALGSDGARYVALAEVAFDRDTEVSWESFIRRYNADLANDFGNLVNRTVSMANRYLAGERPAASDGGSLRGAWERILPAYRSQLEGCLLHTALATLWEFVGAANRQVDLEKPWELAKAIKLGGPDGEAASLRLSAVLGDLVEACRLIALAGAPFLPATAPRIFAQLGYAYPYANDGNAGPPILGELEWGAHSGETGLMAQPEPLFPRLDVEPDATLA
jgi:methionyl-tRNA synthetase